MINESTFLALHYGSIRDIDGYYVEVVKNFGCFRLYEIFSLQILLGSRATFKFNVKIIEYKNL